MLIKVNHQNRLYLIVNQVFCVLGEKNSAKYLKIDKSEVLNIWNQAFAAIKYHINKTDNSELNFDSDFDKIKFITDDSLPLGKSIYFPTLTVVIRCVFKEGNLFYPQVYLDDTLYQL